MLQILSCKVAKHDLKLDHELLKALLTKQSEVVCFIMGDLSFGGLGGPNQNHDQDHQKAQ